MTVIEHLDTPQLSAALDGETDDNVEVHLAACSVCRDELEVWRTTLAPLGLPAEAPASVEAVEASIQAAIFAGSPAAQRRARNGARLIGMSRVAAAVAVVLGVVGSLLVASHAGGGHGAKSTAAGTAVRPIASGATSGSAGTGRAAHTPTKPHFTMGPVHGQAPVATGAGSPTAGPNQSSGVGGAGAGAKAAKSGSGASTATPGSTGTTGSTGESTVPPPAEGAPVVPALGTVDSPAALKTVLNKDLPKTPVSPPTTSPPSSPLLRCLTAAQHLAGTAAGDLVYSATIDFEGKAGFVFVYGAPGAFVAWILQPDCSLLSSVGL